MPARSWTLETLRTRVRTLLQDVNIDPPRWDDEDIFYAINEAICAAGPIGGYGYFWATQNTLSSIHCLFQNTATTIYPDAVLAMWMVDYIEDHTEGDIIKGYMTSRRLQADEYQFICDKTGVYVVTNVVTTNRVYPTYPRLLCVYVQAPEELTASTDSTTINAAYIAQYAAGVCWEMKAAESELSAARHAQAMAQWHFARADELRGQIAASLLGLPPAERAKQ